MTCPNADVFISTFRKIMILTSLELWNLTWTAYISDITTCKELCIQHFKSSYHSPFHRTTSWVKCLGFPCSTPSAPNCRRCWTTSDRSSSEQAHFELIRHQEVERMGWDECTRDLAAPTLGGFCVGVPPWIGSLKFHVFRWILLFRPAGCQGEVKQTHLHSIVSCL